MEKRNIIKVIILAVVLAIIIVMNILIHKQSWVGYLSGLLAMGTLAIMAISTYSGKKLGVALFVSVMAGILAFGIIRATQYQNTPNDKFSQNRLAQLNEVLTSIFGPRWQYVLIAFLILFTVILYFVYKSNINIDFSGNSTYTLWTAIVFLIGMVILAGIAFKRNNPSLSGDFAPSNQTVEIVGLIAAIIAIITGGVFVYKKIS